MPDAPANAVLDRLLRHMAWANQRALTTLQSLPDEALLLHAPNEPEWTIAAITRHLVRSAGFYGYRLGADVKVMEFDPEQTERIEKLANAVAAYDAALREVSTMPEEVLPHTRPDGTTVNRARSTILAQAIHHATEHRAQIAGILTAHEIRAIDLDELDVWEFGDAEGLGH